MANSLQFVGRKATVDAVRNRGLDTWALFQGKQFITAGDGPDVLDEFLKKLEPGGSLALYMVKVYKGIAPDDVTDRTECNGSFTFKLTDPDRPAGTDPAILDRLERIEGMLTGDGEDDEDDDEENSLMGIVMSYIKEPDKLATLIGAFRGAGPAAPVSNSFTPQTIGSTSPPPVYNEAMAQRLGKAIDQLERADPKIIDHLEKLAALSVKNPMLFNLLLTQLDNM
jgi:hypothetical protein